MTVCRHRLCCFLLALAVFLLPSTAQADAGTVQLSHCFCGYRFTIFTSTPLRAGPVEISVLLQDAQTGEPCLGGELTISVCPAGHPEQATRHCVAAGTGTNKLLYCAKFDLPWPGPWEVVVRSGGIGVMTVVEADAPIPQWMDLWLWIALPALPIALFAIDRRLRKLSIRPRGARLLLRRE